MYVEAIESSIMQFPVTKTVENHRQRLSKKTRKSKTNNILRNPEKKHSYSRTSRELDGSRRTYVQ